jgi:hypothetical protein
MKLKDQAGSTQTSCCSIHATLIQLLKKTYMFGGRGGWDKEGGHAHSYLTVLVATLPEVWFGCS